MGLFDNLSFDPQSFGGSMNGLLARLPDYLAQPGQYTGNPTGHLNNPWSPGGMLDIGMQSAPAGMPQQPPPQLPQEQAPQPQAPAAPMAGIGNHLMAGLMGFANSGGPLQAIGNLVQGLATGQRSDPQGMQQQRLAATYQALVQSGVPPGVAQAAAMNPKVLETIAPEYFGGYKVVQTGESPLGKQFQLQGPGAKFYEIPASGAAPGAAPGGDPSGRGLDTYLAPGVKKIDSALSGPAYVSQFSPEVQSALKAWMEGGTMPVGNPRTQGMAALIRTIGPKVAQDMGIPTSDLESRWTARRKMQSDMASSSNSSMGGILSNGKSSFLHLAELSDSFTGLGNRSGPDIPGGSWLGRAANGIGNVVLPTPETSGKIAGVRDNAMKYGAEATKFYSGSGGGVEERMMALKEHAGGTTLATEQAAFLEKEKSLMLDRLHEKEAQIRDVMGQEYLDRHPVMTPELQKNVAKIDANVTRLRAGGANAPSAPAVDPAALAEARRRGLIK